MHPAARRNQARKMYQAELPARPGIGSSMGSAASTPSMAKHPAITNRAMLGACSVMIFLLEKRVRRKAPLPRKENGPQLFNKFPAPASRSLLGEKGCYMLTHL